MFRKACILLAAILAIALNAGCVVYEPYPGYFPGGTNYERAWSAALGGAQDAGVQVSSSDPASGVIRGTRGNIDVIVSVARQPDGTVRVRFDSKGPTQEDQGLAERFSRAYDRRMGR